MWEQCQQCNKPLNNEANIKTLRIIIAGSGLAGTILGGIALPFLGFGLGGITAGSFADFKDLLLSQEVCLQFYNLWVQQEWEFSCLVVLGLQLEY